VSYTRGRDLGGGRQSAGGIGGLLALTQPSAFNPQHFYYHSDGNGNVTSLLDSHQTVAARYQYDPFGNLLASSGIMADVNLYRFSSKEAHANSGLYYYGFRFYEPGLQRWMNRDPIGEAGGLNLYSFVGNNPLMLVDPWGLDWKSWVQLHLVWPAEEAADNVWNVGVAVLFTPQYGNPSDTIEALGNPLLRLGTYIPSEHHDEWNQLAGGVSEAVQDTMLAGASARCPAQRAPQARRAGAKNTPCPKRGVDEAKTADDVTYLYQKIGPEGEHLKFGITKNPATRYTQEELGGGRLNILKEGPRKDMLQLERNLHETLPIGPEEAQQFYILKQIEKGLKPPPYSP
jgi:RHS repeat-associated protein